MGVYGEYLDRQFNFEQLTKERKAQLRRIAEARGGRDVLVIAADLNKPQAPVAIGYEDRLPVHDQLANLSGKALDLILETPGGSGEVAEDIVNMLRAKYDDVAVIVPGYAKSAGTMIAMAADDILMESVSALGPIDAQLHWQGKVFSAQALLAGMEKIKDEVVRSGSLNKAYIPMLQGISPGELQDAENALQFTQEVVADWLAKCKFKNWTIHSSSGKPVSDEDRKGRAQEVAAQLCDHERWRRHGRSLRIADLVGMRLRITDYGAMPDLADAVRRYYALLQMTFATNIYKIFETPDSQILRFIVQAVPAPAEKPGNVAVLEVRCQRCRTVSKVQANLGQQQPLEEGHLPFPKDNRLNCPSCGALIDLSQARRQLEMQTKKPVVA